MTITDLEKVIKSGETLVVANTNEEYRLLYEIFASMGKEYNIWTWAEGTPMRKVNGVADFGVIQKEPQGSTRRNRDSDSDRAEGDPPPTPEVYDVGGADLINQIGMIVNEDPSRRKSRKGKDIFLLRRLNIGPDGIGPDVVNAILNWKYQLRNACLIVVGSASDIHHYLQREIYQFDYSLREPKDVRSFVEESIKTVKGAVKEGGSEETWMYTGTLGGKMVPRTDAYKTKYTQKEVDAISASLSGLTLDEQRKAINYSLRMGKLDPHDLGYLKQDIINKSGILEWVDPCNMNDVGGLDNLKEWLAIRGAAMSSTAAREYGLPPPKGVLMVGLPGGGHGTHVGP